MSIVSSEVAADRIDRGGEETEEEPLVNGFSSLALREQDDESAAEEAAPPPGETQGRGGETAHDVIDMFSQKTGALGGTGAFHQRRITFVERLSSK